MSDGTARGKRAAGPNHGMRLGASPRERAETGRSAKIFEPYLE
jgi:hypothetical protein